MALVFAISVWIRIWFVTSGKAWALRGLQSCEMVPETQVDSRSKSVGKECVVGFIKDQNGKTHHTSLRLMKSSNSRAVPDWLVDLVAASEMKQVRIEGRIVEGTAIEQMLSYPHIEKLELIDCDVSAAGVAVEGGVPKSIIMLTQCRLAPGSERCLADATEIHFADCVISESQLLSVSRHAKKLRTFSCTSPVSVEALIALVEQQPLRHLELYGQDFNGLSEVLNARTLQCELETLRLSDCFPEQDVASLVSCCSHLKACYLEQRSASVLTATSLKSSSESLKELLLAGKGVDDRVLPILQAIPNLNTVMIRDVSFSESAFQAFRSAFNGKILGQR